MSWKKFLAATFMMILLNATVAAQVVTVHGSGVSENAAIKDAKRNAVEQVLGTRIKSESLMVDLELVFDAVQTRSAGYVTSCEILSKNSVDGLIEITARVNVSDEPNSALMQDVELVMTLNDPRLRVQMEYYGDDGGLTLKKYPAQVEAAIREELIKRGFSHIVDSQGEVDFVISGRLTVEKAREVKLPNWRDIGGKDLTLLDTGLSRCVSSVDCKIKKVDTDEVIGEFQSRGDGMDATGNEISQQAVTAMAADAAQQVRSILIREASKVFSGVKISVKADDGDKILALEEILRQTQGVDSVHVRSFKGGQCVIDAGTDLLPQNLYRALQAAAGDSLNMQLIGLTSITLDISVR